MGMHKTDIVSVLQKPSLKGMLIVQTNNYVTNVLEECEICAKATEGNELS